MTKKIKKDKTTEITITGFVEEIELENGEMGLQIDDGDRVYLILMDKIGSKLQNHIDEELDVTGWVMKTADGHELKVNEFRLVDEYSDDYYDDFYDDNDHNYSQNDGEYS